MGSKPRVPAGYVLMRWETLAEILSRHPAPEPERAPAAATFEAFAAGIALTTAHLARLPVEQGELTAGIPAAALIRALTILAAVALAELLPEDHLGAFLQGVGAEVAHYVAARG